jgi:hypothetical protein
MTYHTLLALLASLSLLCWGCDGDDDDSAGDDDVSDDDDTGDDDDDDDTGDDDDTTGPPEEPYLTGTLYDITGTTPLEGVRVTWCQESCIFKNTDADGVFVFGGLDEGEGLFDVVGHINPDERAYTGLLEVIEIPATGFVTAEDVFLPEIPSVEALSGGQQTVDAGAGVQLTFDPDDVEWVLGVPQIGAVEVPDTAWQYVNIPDVEVTSVWAFYVWGSATETPMELTVPMGDIECGDGASIYWMSTEAEHWDVVGAAEEDCGAETLTTPAAGGLTELTWVATGRPL